MTATEPLTLSGVRQGDPCFVVPVDRPAVPIPVAASRLVVVLDGFTSAVKLWHAGRYYDAGEVYATEGAARHRAYELAVERHGSHARAAAEWAAVLEALADEAPVTVAAEDASDRHTT